MDNFEELKMEEIDAVAGGGVFCFTQTFTGSFGSLGLPSASTQTNVPSESSISNEIIIAAVLNGTFNYGVGL